MKKITTSIISTLLFFNVAFAQGKYENQEFSIDSLTSNKEDKIRQPLVMFLSASEGFAPNINIQVQKYNKSLKEYMELSITQFKQLKLKIIQNKQIGNHATFEYTGSMRGTRQLHWYAMAYKKGDSIFLITATATENQWKTDAKELISCVNSFKLK